MPLSVRQLIADAIQDRKDPLLDCRRLMDLQKASMNRGFAYEEIYPASIQTCPGAKAIAEDFLQWVDCGPKLIGGHRDLRHGKRFPRHWAGTLHGVHRYGMDKVFRCCVPQATVFAKEGEVLTDRKEWVTEAFFTFNWRPPRRSHLPKPDVEFLEGSFVSLLTVWGDRNMGHFFFDALLRICLFENLAEHRFIVPADLLPWHKGLLQLAGIKEEQLVQIRTNALRVEKLHVCHITNAGLKPRRELSLNFRQMALEKVNGASPKPTNRRIFVDRSMAKRRKLVNQKELMPVLKERGFEIVRWEDHSIAEQVRIASEANVMAGPHGTSLLNSLYCQPGSKVLEIFSPGWWDTSTMRQCTLVGHEFWYCFGENASKDNDVKVDPRKLAQVLDFMLEQQSADDDPYVKQ